MILKLKALKKCLITVLTVTGILPFYRYVNRKMDLINQQNPDSIFKINQKITMFLIALGIFLLIYGRLIGLGPDWFWQDWQKSQSYYYTKYFNESILLTYTLGVIIIVIGALFSAKDIIRDMKHHKLSTGTFLTITGLILLILLITNTSNSFKLAEFVQENVTLTWILRAFFIEFLTCSILATVTGVTLLLAFGLSKNRSATTMLTVNNDLKEYSSIIMKSIKSNKKIILGLFLTVSGFIYSVFGAWPEMNGNEYLWQWQTQIAGLGNTALWILWLLSFAAFGIGGFMLYQKSKQHR